MLRWILLSLLVSSAAGIQAPSDFPITVTTTVELGRVANVSIDPSSFALTPNGTVFWPFVNGSQWGAFVTCAVAGRPPTLDGACSILLPLPYAGTASITVAVMQAGRDWGGQVNSTAPDKGVWPDPDCDQSRGCVFVVGTPLPPEAIARSQPASVEVTYRKIELPSGAGGAHEVCMDWEPWHTRHNAARWMGRPGASAMPMLGMYSSFHPGVARQHAIWLVEAGVSCIEIDWSNSVWGHALWSARGVGIQELSNASLSTLEVYRDMRLEGHDTPKALFMVGLENGPAATPSEVGNELAWVRDNVLMPLGPDQFVTLDGKPLALVLYTGQTYGQIPNASVTDAVSAQGSFTVRWMGTQLQNNPDLGTKDGFWSWMDGSIAPVPTLRPNGSAEALTVTPAFFAGGGWLAAAAKAQLEGSTLTAEMAVAVKYKPTVLLVCQWNEWNGQPDNAAPPVFVDAYNMSFTNDLEPTALAECGGYVREHDAGQLPVCDTGWGFFNLNLLTATLQSYRDSLDAPPPVHQTTVLRISEPRGPPTHASAPRVVSGAVLQVAWSSVGPATAFNVSIDQGLISVVVPTGNSTTLDVSSLSDGVHAVTVTAVGGETAFPLARGALDTADKHELVPTADKVLFELRKTQPRILQGMQE